MDHIVLGEILIRIPPLTLDKPTELPEILQLDSFSSLRTVAQQIRRFLTPISQVFGAFSLLILFPPCRIFSSMLP